MRTLSVLSIRLASPSGSVRVVPASLATLRLERIPATLNQKLALSATFKAKDTHTYTFLLIIPLSWLYCTLLLIPFFWPVVVSQPKAACKVPTVIPINVTI